MAFTEVQKRKGKNYYYRTQSARDGKKVGKKRIYMGTDLSKKELAKAEKEADREIGILSSLITQDELEAIRNTALAMEIHDPQYGNSVVAGIAQLSMGLCNVSQQQPSNIEKEAVEKTTDEPI